MQALARVRRQFSVVLEERDDGVYLSVRVEIPSAKQLIRIVKHEKADDMGEALEIMTDSIKYGCERCPIIQTAKERGGPTDTHADRTGSTDLLMRELGFCR